LAQLALRLPVVFPVHPRTRGRMEAAGLSAPNLLLTAPLGYLDFLRLTSEARLVLTDSGGIQEETTILGVPCLTVRENTERPVTIDKGTNRLVGTDPRRILEAAIEALGSNGIHAEVPELWDGRTGARIADVLEQAAPARVAAR
jgi:UDP-N-acetylglucosamine 2-epimerase (non-hydrolysing)